MLRPPRGRTLISRAVDFMQDFDLSCEFDVIERRTAYRSRWSPSEQHFDRMTSLQEKHIIGGATPQKKWHEPLKIGVEERTGFDGAEWAKVSQNFQQLAFLSMPFLQKAKQ